MNKWYRVPGFSSLQVHYNGDGTYSFRSGEGGPIEHVLKRDGYFYDTKNNPIGAYIAEEERALLRQLRFRHELEQLLSEDMPCASPGGSNEA